MTRVVRRTEHADEGLAIRVGEAVIAVRRGFDPQLLRDVMSALGSVR